MKRIVFLLVCIACFTAALFAADFGGIVSGRFEVEGNDETRVIGAVGFVPWFSLPIGEADFYLSAGFRAIFEDETLLVPELNRLEFTFRPLPSLAIRAGRIPWQDPSRFTARGLFDGADVVLDLGRTRLGMAALYTGFLYKETAAITISPADTKNYTASFDWADFANTYFAPPRVLAALYGEFPGFPSRRGHLYAGLMAQFDLSDADERFHTQYLLLRHSLAYRAFDLAAAAAIGLENTQADGVQAAYAFTLEGGVRLSATIRDRLSLGVRWASGDGPQTAAFFPIIWEAQGLVLKPGFSGIMRISAQYEVRLLPPLSAIAGCRYYLRTDSTSFSDSYLEDESYFLGAEIVGSLLWVPFSDCAFSLNTGVFLPQTGAAFAEQTPVRFTLTLETIISF